jgi:pyrroloquinoline quinone biosynthesis protein D
VSGSGPGLRLDASAVPRLRPRVRLQFNEARGQWVVQAPERVLMPDEIAVAVLRRCDGSASIEAIAAALAEEYGAPRQAVQDDVLEILQDLFDKGVVEDARADRT